MTNEIESAIEFVNEVILEDDYNRLSRNDSKHLYTLLSVAQLFVEAQKGMPEKKKIVSCPHGEMTACDDCIDKNKEAIGFNSAIDLCTAHLVKKCEGIEDVLRKYSKYSEEYSRFYISSDEFTDLSQAIKEYLVKGEEK